MYIVKWDKQSKINGVDPAHFMSNHPEFEHSDVLLISAFEGGQIRSVESVNTLREVMNMYEASTEDIIKAYPKWRETTTNG